MTVVSGGGKKRKTRAQGPEKQGGEGILEEGGKNSLNLAKAGKSRMNVGRQKVRDRAASWLTYGKHNTWEETNGGKEKNRPVGINI